VRESVGDHVQLRLDAGGHYDAPTARELCRGLEDQQIQFLTDPLQSPGLFAVAALGRQTHVPLAVWRGIGEPSDVLALVRCGNIPFVVVDLEQVGGLVPARNCAAVAHAGGLSAVLASGPSLGSPWRRCCTWPPPRRPSPVAIECNYYQLREDVLVEPLEISHGMVAVPQAPGLGVEVDRGKIERYQVA